MEALLLIDVQKDFLPNGALAVPHGDAILPLVRARMATSPLVFATQDWHPADHESFASQHAGARAFDAIELHGLPQTLWPDHCVQGTAGAELHASLDRGRIKAIVRKGQDRTVDSYSGFFDNARRRDTGLAQLLAAHGVTSLTMVGLATDYCVKFTALDARSLGFEVTLLLDGCRGIDLAAGDLERALQEMRDAGVHLQSG